MIVFRNCIAIFLCSNCEENFRARSLHYIWLKYFNGRTVADAVGNRLIAATSQPNDNERISLVNHCWCILSSQQQACHTETNYSEKHFIQRYEFIAYEFAQDIQTSSSKIMFNVITCNLYFDDDDNDDDDDTTSMNTAIAITSLSALA